MLNSLLYALNPANFEAHGAHFAQAPVLFWVFIVSNLVTFVAYTLIPIALTYFIWKRKDMMFGYIFWLFGLFIILCGIHHLLYVITFWYPIYGLEAINDMILALVSIATFFVLLSILPMAVKLRSPAEMEKINKQLRQDEEKMQSTLDSLHAKTLELEAVNKTMVNRELKMVELKKEIEDLKKEALKNG